MLYLAEKTSEHPIAISICEQVTKNIPTVIENIEANFVIENFKNRNGEGVVANVLDKTNNKKLEVLCGNLKLMKNFDILKRYGQLERNIELLQEEGKTVVMLVIDKVP